MKLFVYAVEFNGVWRWLASFDLDLDAAFWQQRKPQAMIYRLREALPANKALELLRWGNQSAEPVVPGRPPGCPPRIAVPFFQGVTAGGAAESELWGHVSSQPKAADKLLSLSSLARRAAAALQGRLLLPAELSTLLRDHRIEIDGYDWRAIVQMAYLGGKVRYMSGMVRDDVESWWPLGRNEQLRCGRCGSGGETMERTHCGICGTADCAYCTACFSLGKIRACSLLIYGNASDCRRSATCEAPSSAHFLDEAGQAERLRQRWSLSPAQARASAQALAFLQRRTIDSFVSHLPKKTPPDTFLIWAVTGAGKTEMIFPLIDHDLQRGGRTLIATPRKDVVLELLPRLKRSFPNVRIAALYGGSDDRWRHGELTISTTHQLLRFRHAFSLVIVDEVDAFPYHNNPLLVRAARRACRPGGRFIFLSATPPKEMQREIARGKVEHVKVPARFHGYPLPVPNILCRRSESLRLRLLVKELGRSIERGAQCFVFVPRIGQVSPLVQTLSDRLSGVNIAGTSSRDAKREAKVLAFRDKSIRVLVTTTILERGVTVPQSDVFVYEADASLFDEAALVQMAGRAGRSADDPDGKVCFISHGKTSSQTGAVRMIQRMNRLARRLGYLRQS